MGGNNSLNRNRRNEEQSRQNGKLTQSDIDQYLPSKPFQEYKPFISDKNNMFEYNEDIDCIICLEPFNSADNTKLTPCYHIYHDTCISEWLLKNQNCPFCRSTLNKKEIIKKSKEKMVEKHIKNGGQKVKGI